MSDQSLFFLMIFFIGFLLLQAFAGPAMGGRGSRRRLRERIRNLSVDPQGSQHLSLVREHYLKDLSPWELRLRGLPGMDGLQSLIEQAGSSQQPQRAALTSLAAAAAAGSAAGYVLNSGFSGLLIAVLVGALPLLLLRHKRAKRLARFEEQLPDALTTAARAMRAGLPFTEALNLVAQEMKEPVGKEFGIVYTEINYGGDARGALLGLLERVPSVAVTAMVTSVLIQRDTGGNLAEVLDKLAGVVRQRFRFQRTMLTLSAEGRLGGQIMSLLPFFMAGLLSLVAPDFLPQLTQDPTGRKLILGAFGLMVVGILWMRRISHIDI
ncbi:type II secretion system F family protein [uncultured Thiodictyon sp.]|jgi:tight adherence protein B|uniref:type II secretion system F family protein n=1 Tax=uncultured Thiodictyon sp. TaxID=1846217 RepID=UPI0025EB1C4F|nr:type II secretion system F family protein [uncultured Thiodictyon sp.]